MQVRRPAIQKQFYDIEERVIIRPAGSAVVELDEPTSKSQKEPAVIQPLSYDPVHASPIQVKNVHSLGQPGSILRSFFNSSTGYSIYNCSHYDLRGGIRRS